MLYLIGTGLYYLNDLPLRAINELKECDEILLERYTNLNDISFLEELEKKVGKKIEVIRREVMESDAILKKASKEKLAVLIPGDPLAATTHFSLIQECKNLEIKIKILHSSSIFTAVGETGLSMYKFGGTTSIPIYSENFHPESFFEIIQKNIECGYHSLVLLDVKNKEEFVEPYKAIQILKEIERKKDLKIVDWENVIAISKIGSDCQKIVKASNIEIKNLEPPCSLIIPGKLNENEKEALGVIN